MKFPRPSEHVLPDKIPVVPVAHISQNSDVDRFIGSIVGLAVGDALGASVEFRPHQFFLEHPVVDMEGGGTWGLRSGQWTDDTSMALCLASSLITKGGYDPYDQMVRYKWWYKYGYLSSTGDCFDIGNATRDSLEQFIYRQKSLVKHFHCDQKEVDELSWDDIQSSTKFDVNCSGVGVAGNGALMRLAPIPLFFHQYPEMAVEYAGCSARLTHGDQKAVDACRYYAALIVAAVSGESKEDLLNNNFYRSHRQWFGSVSLHPEILHVAQGSYKNPKGYEGGIRGKGYIVNALEAALWAFWSDNGSFETGALAAVNLGDDTDTTAAIYGQLAGAFYGCRKIPDRWRTKVYAYNLLECVGQSLYLKGKEYNPTSKGRKVISTEQSPNPTSFIDYQDKQTFPSSKYSPVNNMLQTMAPNDRESMRTRFDSYVMPTNDYDSKRYSTRHGTETQAPPWNRDNYGISRNTFNKNQPAVHQRTQEESTIHHSDADRILRRRLDQPNDSPSIIDYNYNTGQSGHYASAYDGVSGYDRNQGKYRQPDSYLGRVSMNSPSYKSSKTGYKSANSQSTLGSTHRQNINPTYLTRDPITGEYRYY